MKRILIPMFLLALLLLANFSFAATASEAALQVTGYSVVPTKVYPGTNGYIQLTLENSGTDVASGIKVDYSNNYDYKTLSVYPGDIDVGANSQISVPFEVPQSLSTGLILYKMNVYYLTTSGGGSSKLTTFSVPITVSQNEILQVDTLSIVKDSLTPGEKISVQLNVKNTGGTINDLSISSPQNSSFSIDGSTRKSVGSIPSNSNQTLTLRLVSSSLAPVGQYLIPLTFAYTDSLQNPVTQTLNVGPVNVLDSSSQIKVSLEPLSSTEVGSTAEFNLAIENDGSGTTSAIVAVGSSDVFTPLGTRQFYFDSIAPGKSASGKVSLGISATVTSGYYQVPLNITLSTGKTFTQTIGIHVEATPEVKITGELSTSTTGSEIDIQVSNTGNTPIRSVYATAEFGGTKVDKFMGTMNIDDYATLAIPLSSFGGSAAGSANAGGQNAGPGRFNRTQDGGNTTAQPRSVTVTVTFKDEQNQPHTVTQDVNVNFGAAGAGNTFRTTGTTRSNGIIFGLDAIQLGAAIVVLTVVGYFLYRRRKRKAPAV